MTQTKLPDGLKKPTLRQKLKWITKLARFQVKEYLDWVEWQLPTASVKSIEIPHATVEPLYPNQMNLLKLELLVLRFPVYQGF